MSFADHFPDAEQQERGGLMGVARGVAGGTMQAGRMVVGGTMDVTKSVFRPVVGLFQSSVPDIDSLFSEEDDDDTVFDAEDEGAKTEQGNNLAAKETRGVNVWRALVILALLSAGATTATLAYKILNDNEQEDFRYSYELFVRNIEDAASAQLLDGFRAFESLAETITANALQQNQTFPFVTVPEFEISAEKTRRLSGIEMVQFCPIVEEDNLAKWISHSNANQEWLQISREIVTEGDELLISSTYLEGNIAPIIYQHDADYNEIPATDKPYLPTWLVSPPPYYPGYINYNMMAELFVQRSISVVEATKEPWFTEALDASRLGSTAINIADHDDFHRDFVDTTRVNDTTANGSWSGFQHPHSVFLFPVFDRLAAGSDAVMVGLLQGLLPWDRYLTDLLPDGVTGITAILGNTCGQSFTYKLNGAKAVYLGEGDMHDTKWNSMGERLNVFQDVSAIPEGVDGLVCSYFFDLYPTDALEDVYTSSVPRNMAWIVAVTFFAMAATFFIYDRFVRRRNEKVVKAALQANKVVDTLFPANVRDRLLAEEIKAEKEEQQGAQTRLKNFLANDGPAAGDMETDDIMYKTKPIADLFPETSVLFADIAGFTAWSSAREPSQVFTLLETVYRAFDEIAKRRRVFKVETVGDCYVAATGLPEPRADHAVAMARFAKDCMLKMQGLTRKLEVSLGPDTADLAMRMGIHSGPVTAGVLRGEKSRFQLFGDTMNTASRMESTGVRDHIQISQDTADLLIAAGKKSWITPRSDVIVAKGKGEMQTFWIQAGNKGKGSGQTGIATHSVEDVGSDVSESSEDVSENEGEEEVLRPTTTAKIARLIDWNVDVLLRLLKAIVAHRQAKGDHEAEVQPEEDFARDPGATVLDEVEERISLPEFDPAVAKKMLPPDQIALEPAAESQLYEYVAALAAMYRDNPFHNFEHASHVTMSVSKLMSRIVAPSDIDFQDAAAKNAELHDHTYGITSDPLTQFSCVLSALIHDVDHTGVPNTQLVKENSRIANYYKGRSVAEQNSVDVAWDLLFDDCYEDLRRTIYTTNEELQRFRKLVVNSVMATDIMDKDLKALRNARWEKAFSESARIDHDPHAAVNRKATIVIEHLIQASDVAHTMQHWHIYRKWNAKLFEEMYKAYHEGRADKNPADFWYKGEIGFFDFYIIPLAKKLKNCGVFGVSSDEYLNYAERNRKEWEARGQEVVSELIENIHKIYPPKQALPPPEAAPESAPERN